MYLAISRWVFFSVLDIGYHGCPPPLTHPLLSLNIYIYISFFCSSDPLPHPIPSPGAPTCPLPLTQDSPPPDCSIYNNFHHHHHHHGFSNIYIYTKFLVDLTRVNVLSPVLDSSGTYHTEGNVICCFEEGKEGKKGGGIWKMLLVWTTRADPTTGLLMQHLPS